MKNTTTLLLAGSLLATLGSCSSGGSGTSVTPSSAFSTMYPAIGSVTLKQIGSGHYTGNTAHVDASGNLIVKNSTGMITGTYIIRLRDSSAPPTINGINMYRGGVDTLINGGGGIRHTVYPGGEVYYLQLAGGPQPQDSITHGVYLDSL